MPTVSCRPPPLPCHRYVRPVLSPCHRRPQRTSAPSTRPAATEPRPPRLRRRPRGVPGSRPGVRAESSSAPARTRRQYGALAAEATEVCASCPLLTACLYRAVVEYDVAGFVAGTTERQRGEIRARLGVEVEPEDFDTLAGVVGGQRSVDHDEVVRLRRAHPDESLERHRPPTRLLAVDGEAPPAPGAERALAPRAGAPAASHRDAQVRRATAETLAENSGNRRAAA